MSAPHLAATSMARRTGTSPVAAAMISQRTGATPTRTSAVALTLPTVATTSANRAGWRQPPARAARMIRATIQGSPAKGRRITESRAAMLTT